CSSLSFFMLIVGFIVSTTSTLVNETPVSLDDKKESTLKARRASISESLFHNPIALHRPKSIARPLRPLCRRLTSTESTMQTSVTTPESKISSQIIPKSKSSAHYSFTQVVQFARKGYF
ncbi:hypothetical protein BT96DRAFT_920300, partial [Gymnopus androsaceus JB14]